MWSLALIVSERHKFVFIHNRKTAGTSIAVALSPSLGPTDTQLSGLEETWGEYRRLPRKMMRQALLGLGRISRPTGRKESIGRLLASSAKATYRDKLGPKPQHAPADKVREYLGETFSRYYKFCFVRNPFDYAFSDYAWRTRAHDQPPSFVEYLEALSKGNSMNGLVPVRHYNNWFQYTVDDKVVVDDLLFFDDLDVSFRSILDSLGIIPLHPLPRLKRSVEGRPHTLRPPEYSAKTRSLVSELYRQEIRHFGFRCDY